MFNKKEKENSDDVLSMLTIPAFGYELIREQLLKDLLGNDYNSILYWGGKNVARKNPLESVDHIIHFFEKAGWGTLSVSKEGKNEIIFELTSEWIVNRFKRDGECSFQIEAGFLAEQMQNIVGQESEAMEQQKKKHSIVTFTVQWE